jgi:hypothetical protein
MDEARDNIRKIKNSLKNILIKIKQIIKKIVKKILQKATLKIYYLKSGLDITAIDAVDFHHNLKNENNELFSTSLYEIDRIIEERRNILAFIKKKLAYVPEAYKDFIDIFFKAASDKLFFY